MKRFGINGRIITCMLGFVLAAASFLLFPFRAEAAEPSKELYTFVSPRYGYTMLCPSAPAGVIPASMFYEDNNKKGDVIVFDSTGYNVKYAWVVLVDAFDDKSVPDLNKISEKEAGEYLQKLMHSYGYEGISLINLSDSNKAIYGLTARSLEIDTNGDGVPDTTAEAATQMAVTFFRTEKGRCVSVQLIDNPTIREDALAAYQRGVTTLREYEGKSKK